MNTKIVPFKEIELLDISIQRQTLMRTTPLNDWLKIPSLSDRLSGTLKKNARVGFKYQQQLEHEAICQTLGFGFEILPSTYLTFNDPITEGDCHPLTEVGWHMDRLLFIQLFKEDVFKLQYINIQDKDGKIERQGVGIIVEKTSIQWIRKGSICFALMTEFNSITKTWSPCINPF